MLKTKLNIFFFVDVVSINKSKLKTTYVQWVLHLFSWERKKTVYPSEMSAFQPLETIRSKKRENGGVLSYKLKKKTYSAMVRTFFISLCLEQISFLVKRAGWIHSNYTFEQEKNKKNFIIIIQKSWQKAKKFAEKDFYKALINPAMTIEITLTIVFSSH